MTTKMVMSKQNQNQLLCITIMLRTNIDTHNQSVINRGDLYHAYLVLQYGIKMSPE
jgi:hypothetical protein